MPFLVKIGKHEMLDVLKKVLKKEKENILAGIDSDTLNIWKVSESSCVQDEI